MNHDAELANHVRDKLAQLRSAIEDAQGAGLSVEISELAHLYLTHGVASGAAADWKIYRNH